MPTIEMEMAASGACTVGDSEPVLAKQRSLYTLPLQDLTAESSSQRWTTMSRDGKRSAARTGLKQLSIIHHGAFSSPTVGEVSQGGQYPRTAIPSSEDAVASVDTESAQTRKNAVPVSLTLPHAVMDFAFSNCGEFLAVADAGGVLHLFKSQCGRALFAYPVVAPNNLASDSVQVVAFATSTTEEDLLVLTQAGALIRLGNLQLTEIEQTLAREASHHSALRAIMASIQLQQVQVGKLNDGSRSILLARRYARSLFVTIANHGAALSVWKTSRDESSINRHAVYDVLPDGEAVKQARLAMQDRYLAVLSRGGALTWWDWRELVLLFPLDLPGIETFTGLDNVKSVPANNASLVVAVSRCASPIVEVVEVQLHSLGQALETIVRLSLPGVVPSHRIMLTALAQSSGQSQELIVTHVATDTLKTFIIDSLDQDYETETTQSGQGDTMAASEGVACAQELRGLRSFDLQDTHAANGLEAKLEKCFSEIGRDLEDSRIIIECVIEFGKRLRQSQEIGTSGISRRVFGWLDRIASTSYKWTTFTLLLSTVNSSGNGSQSLTRRWHSFCSANLLGVMCHYVKRGMMRAVSLLWERHVRDEAVESVGSVLRHLPEDLPFVAYKRWLRSDVVPSIVRLVERQADRGTTAAVGAVESFAVWVVERILYFADKEDIETALELCSLLRPSTTDASQDSSATSSLRWALLRVGGDASEGGGSIVRIEELSRQLEHMKYLKMEHSFKISLSVFAEESPVTIAMSMLDRCTSADGVNAEVHDHVAPYLRYCGRTTDPVLLEYTSEVLESSPTTTSTGEQSRLLAIIDEIRDVEFRTNATLLFFGSLLPPFSVQVKQFTKKCVTWDTRQIDTIQEHVRLMDIQDMLTGYGVAQFKVGDARSGSRMVSHILAQISRDSAFVDALQLVRAYSHLNVERAALEYLENILTLDVSSAGVGGAARETMRRSSLIKSTVYELKTHFAATPEDSWKIVPVMEEALALGLSLLETKETEDESKSRSANARMSGSIGFCDVAFFLGLLEAAVDVFLSESSDLEMPESEDFGSRASGQHVLHTSLLSSIQRIRRMHSEWGVVVSVKTLRDPALVSSRVKAFIQPDLLFDGIESTQSKRKPVVQSFAGKGKKRALGAMVDQDSGDTKRLKTTSTDGLLQWKSVDEQQDDQKTKLAFDLQRYATHMGMAGDEYHSLVAQVAAEHGDILKAVQYSRDLFSRRRGASSVATQDRSATSKSSGLALKNISLSISKYTATHTEDIYNLATQGHGQIQQMLTPIQLARMQAPMYSLELLRYAICVCDTVSFEETLVLLKSATLLHDILQFTQIGSVSFSGGANKEGDDKWRIYSRWFREDTLCVLPSAQTMDLATRFAIAEHRLLMEYGSSNATGLLLASSPIPSTELLASKRFVTFLVENNADLLSLQVILSMQWVPEDALTVIQNQVIKLISTVFQSRSIDNFLALGLMLTMDQRDAFIAFRRQISRENVAKDFNRFQQIGKVGADSARAWQQVAFLNQCVELEGNARWWHYLNLLDIPCNHKAFQSERRDLDYIRTLVPALLAKSSYDFYTIQEFTRHYQIDDSFAALVYVEALLTNPEAATGSSSLEYQDRIVGVLEDIHEQRLVALLLKTLPKVPGTDYERLLFVFQLLLEHTSYADKEEIERRIEILHVLKAFGVSTRGLAIKTSSGPEGVDGGDGPESRTGKQKICFHQMMAKPRDVLSEVLTTRSFGLLSNLALPLRLESDELLMLLLKNVIGQHRKPSDISSVASPSPLSGSELERLFGILASLRAIESKITAGEWLAEHLPVSAHKLRALEFALEAAIASSSGNSAPSRGMAVSSNTTFMGIEALTRLEQKVLRVKVQLIFLESNVRRFFDQACEANLLNLLVKQPKELFFELYRLTDASSATASHSGGVRDDYSLHRIADRVAGVLKLPGAQLRMELVRELLVKDAVYVDSQTRHETHRKRDDCDSPENIFTPLEEERRRVCDERLITKITYVATKTAQEAVEASELSPAMALVEFLVTFARDVKPRPGVTFRAKLRAARTVLHLAQSHRSVVVAAVESKMKLAAFDAVIKELVDYIRHCKYMIIFEEHRVPYEVGFVMRAKKEALVRSLLRQHSSKEPWVLRCVSNLMLDFDVHAPDLWEFTLTNMHQRGMFRSLSRVLSGLSQLSFVRSVNGASDVWETTLLSPLHQLKALNREHGNPIDSVQTTDESPETYGGVAVHFIRAELELMVGMLQKCPFLDQVDVAAFVVHLRDLTTSVDASSALAKVDLYSYAVRCAMVIPRPSARLQALQRIIQAGAYMQVLAQVCDASVLFDAPLESSDHGSGADWLGGDDNDDTTEQLALLEAIFSEAAQRDEHEKLLGSPFEQGFLEFLAATGDIDGALAIMLRDKRLEAASTLVELLYESHPDRAPPNWTVDELAARDATSKSSRSSRWSFLQQYVAASTSSHLASFREMAN